MTVYGYLERPYLEDPYLAGFAVVEGGWQARLVVEAKQESAWQANAVIDARSATGWESLAFIAVSLNEGGWQGTLQIDGQKNESAWQAQAIAAGDRKVGWQALVAISSPGVAGGFEVKQDTLAHVLLEYPHGYLDDPYLTVPYLGPWMQAMSGWQARGFIVTQYQDGWQGLMTITSRKNTGWQAKLVIDKLRPYGWQALALKATAAGWQVTAVLYNTTQLRIIYEFPSRGASTTGGGNNAWGSPKGTGQNWLASTTEASPTDAFGIQNVNTDITEQRWQGAAGVITGVTLDCDTEINQGVFNDTFAIIDTNITSSATITLIGSNTDDFSVVGVAIALQSENDGNIVYIAPDLPNAGYRYWRIAIDDSTNPDGYLRCGTIVFGAALILTQNFVDQVQIDPVNYTDEVFTEGFTNVQNDRGIKQLLRLEFKNLRYQDGDYQRLRTFFRTARTVLKALWVPTPGFPKRYLTFGKLRRIPQERHNVKSVTNDLVSFMTEVDESK
jgi:hypothetical protein